MESIVACILGFLATLVDAGTGGAIGFGVLAALVRAARLGLQFKTGLDTAMSEIRVTLGRWLALALELALAADILRTVMVPTWDEIGKLGAIVVLRTVLNYFLQREIEQEQQKKAEYVLHDVHACDALAPAAEEAVCLGEKASSHNPGCILIRFRRHPHSLAL